LENKVTIGSTSINNSDESKSPKKVVFDCEVKRKPSGEPGKASILSHLNQEARKFKPRNGSIARGAKHHNTKVDFGTKVVNL